MTLFRLAALIAKVILPTASFEKLRAIVLRPTKSRRDSNKWLKYHCADVIGKVLSIGSGTDEDGQGRHYRDYFPLASSYTTSETTADFNSDIIIDVRSMPEVADGSYDCVFCSGVLEHVDDFQKGISEITRIIRNGGLLLIGVPFRQPIHLAPTDYWRFTEFGMRYLLAESFDIIELKQIDINKHNFPATYWIKSRKK